MYFYSIPFYINYLIFFNLIEKFYFSTLSSISYFDSLDKLSLRSSFFMDPLCNRSVVSSINCFLLTKLFFSFPRMEKVRFIRKLDRSLVKKRRFMSKLNRHLVIGFSFFSNKKYLFNYFELLMRYSIHFFNFFLEKEKKYLLELFIFQNNYLLDSSLKIWVPRVAFHLGSELFFDYFFFFFEGSMYGLNFELSSSYNCLFFNKILLSLFGSPIN